MSQTEPAGQQLIQTVVDHTGLPEELVHREITQILELTGTSSDRLTLDDFRQAMLAYLEQMHASIGSIGDEVSDGEVTMEESANTLAVGSKSE